MKSYGFKIHYLDMSNEWNYVTPSDVRDIVGYMKTVLGDDMPLVIAPSTWSFTQGVNWLKGVNSAAKRAAIDIVSSHNTGRQGTPEDFAAAGRALGKEVWDTEVHGWKGATPADEIPTFSQWLDRIRAGFSGLDSWLAIGTTAQKHCYILNNGSKVTRNVKYYIFRKLTTTSNHGHALDINLPPELTATAALIRSNLVTVWVLNNTDADVPVNVTLTGWDLVTPRVGRTRWHEALPIEGVSDTIQASSAGHVNTTIQAHSLYCFEMTVDAGNTRPVARDDYYFGLRNTPLPIRVLANDADPDGGELSIASYTQGFHGEVTQAGPGVLSYVPEVNFIGEDQFSYSVSDGQGGTDTAEVHLGIYPAGFGLAWTNRLVAREAFIRGGGYADEDQDEAAEGVLLVKHHPSNPDFMRKAYFQFDLDRLFVPDGSRAVFTVQLANDHQQNVQLWALDQAYLDFTPAVTWNTAQANDPTGNDLLTQGPFTATRMGSVTYVPTGGRLSQSFVLLDVRKYIRDDRLTLVLTGAPEDGSHTNHSGGLRLARNRATLRILALPLPPPDRPQPPKFTAVVAEPDGEIALEAEGEAGVVYQLEGAPRLRFGEWSNLGTNLAGADGRVWFRDSTATNETKRFYRLRRP
ncbi:MAG: hypothetical protein D6766_05660 [Verrucomicrobia bacterium]|nr:MAG: hypothetical protein D6766_05660 [Verrucomicrobiota bacterium]